MPLNIFQIQNLVEERPRDQEIEEAVVMAARLRFHIDPVVNNFHHRHHFHDENRKSDESFTGRHHNFYLTHFLHWLGLTIEDRQKQKRFLTFLHNGPYPTVELNEKIWNKRDRIFRAQDAFMRAEFTDESLNADSEEYLKAICFEEFMGNVVRNHEKTSPNSFVIIDLPRVELNENGEPLPIPGFPEPVPVLVDIRSIIDYNRDDKELTHCIYHADPSPEFPDGSIISIDSQSYWIIPKKDDTPIWGLAIEIPHELGFVPAVQIGKKQLKKQNNLIRSNILVSALGELDSLLIAQISKKYLDGYMNPIMELLEEECDYKDADGNHCVRGLITFQQELSSGDFHSVERDCPSCKSRSMFAPGTVITRPSRKEGEPEQGDVAKFITPDVGFLEYTREEINKQKEDIIGSTVGVMVEGNEAAKNEVQIEAGTESRMDVLLSESENRALIKQEIVNILFTIRYRELFIRVIVFGGTQFLLRTTKQIREDMIEAKKAGANQTELMEMKEELIRTEFANDKQKQALQLLLLQLEPVATSTLAEAQILFQDGLISKESLTIKANFFTFVKKFGREVGDPLEFLALSSFAQKIDIIKQIFEGYAREIITETEKGQGQEQNNDTNRGGQPKTTL